MKLFYFLFFIYFDMEKRKKCQKENDVKLFSKKSKPFINSNKWFQQTKESLGNKSVLRKSISGHKKDKKQMLQKNSSANNIRMSNTNNRYFTQSLSNKTQHCKQLKKQKLIISNFISPQRNTVNDVFRSSAKDRLSLNQTKNIGKPSENKSTLCSELSFKELQNYRKQIQSSIKKVCVKETIGKKDFLRITNEYEKLLDRIVFSQMVNQSIQPLEDMRLSNSNNIQSQTFRVNNDNRLNKDITCPGLQLQNIRNKNINDYQDEFMSHYDQLSQSWKRDLAAQKRF